MNRPPVYAGRYYFPDAGRLRAAVESFIEDATVMRPSTLRPFDKLRAQGSGHRTQGSGRAGELIGLIVPHGPLMEMGPVAGHAYKMLLTTPLRWDVTMLLAPTLHAAPALQCDSREAYDTPLDALRIDHDEVARLRAAGVPIELSEDDEPVIECHAPFVLSALGNVPALPLRLPLNADVAAMKAVATQLGFMIAIANLPAGHESAACDAIVQLNGVFFAGRPVPKKRGLSSLLGKTSTPVQPSADNHVLAAALELARANGATAGVVLQQKGVYAACALYRG